MAHTVRLFASHQEIDQIVLVVSEADYADVLALVDAEKLQVTVTLGGAERQDSVRNGLASLASSCTYVLVHDAARPFVTQQQISDILRQVRRDQATIMAVPVKDTIKVVGATGLVEALSLIHI